MSREIRPPSAARRAQLRAIAERSLSLDEWRSRLAEPITPEEREHALALIRWFRRRYPTPAARLAYVRRAHTRWLS